MAQVKTSKPLTYYIDTPSVRVFQTFAGDTLEKIDQLEAWDIITVLSQAASLANINDWGTIDIEVALDTLDTDIEVSKNCYECLKALQGFPAAQVNLLMMGILGVAFEEEIK
jgi:hypothetical protein